jgi:hypothetical protein
MGEAQQSRRKPISTPRSILHATLNGNAPQHQKQLRRLLQLFDRINGRGVESNVEQYLEKYCRQIAHAASDSFMAPPARTLWDFNITLASSSGGDGGTPIH